VVPRETFRQKNPVELSILTLTDREIRARVSGYWRAKPVKGYRPYTCFTLVVDSPFWSESRAAKKATSAKVAFFVSTIALSYMVLPSPASTHLNPNDTQLPKFRKNFYELLSR
jgi:hypothetical protein